jgi:eukaryotic translation initiation factor 2-alpha kinase 4
MAAKFLQCDVLVASFDQTILRTNAVKVLQDLWANGISAELAVDASSLEELMGRYRDDNHSWIVIVKQDSKERGFKVRSLNPRDEFDVRPTELVSWLRNEIRARNQRDGVVDQPKLSRHTSQPDTGVSVDERTNDVRILVAQHRSKKTNRRNIIESGKDTIQERFDIYNLESNSDIWLALLHSRELVDKAINGPIAAIDTRDDILDALRDTRLSDPDGWRNVIHNAPLTDRKYLSQVHELLHDLANEYCVKKDGSETYQNAFIYNYRTGSCIYYDLGKRT